MRTPTTNKEIETISRELGANKSLASVCQGHKALNEPTINPARITKVVLDFSFNNHLRNETKLAKPTSAPKANINKY